MEAADLLEKEGLSVAVINARFAKPVDNELVRRFAETTPCLVTVEEHALKGGFGSAILEVLQEEGLTERVAPKCIGLEDIVLEHGAPNLQRKDLKLDDGGYF